MTINTEKSRKENVTKIQENGMSPKTNEEEKQLFPSRLAAQVHHEFPEVWSEMARLAALPQNPLSDAHWDERCYVPVGDTIALCEYYSLSKDAYPILGAVAPWRLEKNVFRFNPDFLDELLEPDPAIFQEPVPIEKLLSLPFRSIWVEAPPYRFFAYLEDDCYPEEGKPEHWEIRFTAFDKDDQMFSAFLDLIPGATIGECIINGIRESFRVMSHKPEDDRSDLENFMLGGMTTEQADTFLKKELLYNRVTLLPYLLMTLYICTPGAAVTESKASNPTIRKFDVGKFS